MSTILWSEASGPRIVQKVEQAASLFFGRDPFAVRSHPRFWETTSQSETSSPLHQCMAARFARGIPGMVARAGEAAVLEAERHAPQVQAEYSEGIGQILQSSERTRALVLRMSRAPAPYTALPALQSHQGVRATLTRMQRMAADPVASDKPPAARLHARAWSWMADTMALLCLLEAVGAHLSPERISPMPEVAPGQEGLETSLSDLYLRDLFSCPCPSWSVDPRWNWADGPSASLFIRCLAGRLSTLAPYAAVYQAAGAIMAHATEGVILSALVTDTPMVAQPENETRLSYLHWRALLHAVTVGRGSEVLRHAIHAPLDEEMVVRTMVQYASKNPQRGDYLYDMPCPRSRKYLIPSFPIPYSNLLMWQYWGVSNRNRTRLESYLGHTMALLYTERHLVADAPDSMDKQVYMDGYCTPKGKPRKGAQVARFLEKGGKEKLRQEEGTALVEALLSPVRNAWGGRNTLYRRLLDRHSIRMGGDRMPNEVFAAPTWEEHVSLVRNWLLAPPVNGYRGRLTTLSGLARYARVPVPLRNTTSATSQEGEGLVEDHRTSLLTVRDVSIQGLLCEAEGQVYSFSIAQDSARMAVRKPVTVLRDISPLLSPWVRELVASNERGRANRRLQEHSIAYCLSYGDPARWRNSWGTVPLSLWEDGTPFQTAFRLLIPLRVSLRSDYPAEAPGASECNIGWKIVKESGLRGVAKDYISLLELVQDYIVTSLVHI